MTDTEKDFIETPTSSKNQNIILIGFMGSGKTVVGRHIARLLDYQFVDTDDEITAVTGLTLPQLLRKHGEIRFHSEERLIIQKLAKNTNQVIASGGSLNPNLDNLRLFQANSCFVMLRAQPEVILERIKRKSHRPLPAGKQTIESLRALLEEREAQYLDLANLVVDTAGKSVEEIAQIIVNDYLAQQA